MAGIELPQKPGQAIPTHKAGSAGTLLGILALDKERIAEIWGVDSRDSRAVSSDSDREHEIAGISLGVGWWW